MGKRFIVLLMLAVLLGFDVFMKGVFALAPRQNSGTTAEVFKVQHRHPVPPPHFISPPPVILPGVASPPVTNEQKEKQAKKRKQFKERDEFVARLGENGLLRHPDKLFGAPTIGYAYFPARQYVDISFMHAYFLGGGGYHPPGGYLTEPSIKYIFGEGLSLVSYFSLYFIGVEHLSAASVKNNPLILLSSIATMTVAVLGSNGVYREIADNFYLLATYDADYYKGWMVSLNPSMKYKHFSLTFPYDVIDNTVGYEAAYYFEF